MHRLYARAKCLILIVCSLFICGNSYASDPAMDASSGSTPTFTDVAGEYYHFLALDSNGKVWGWGNNIYGQLGDIAQSYRVAPVQIKGIEDVKLISAGYWHSTAVKEDGTVWQWGAMAAQPLQVQGIDDVVAISDSAYFTLALRQDGTVWGWGSNSIGQLGTGRTSYYEPTPVQVQALTDVTAIYAAFNESFALTSDGKVWRWGSVTGCSDECIEESVSTPIRFEGLQDVKAISDGIAVRKDGTAATWGMNDQGSVGNGSMDYAYYPGPIDLPSLKDIVSASKTHAITGDGQVWAWGANNYGQVGDGTDLPRPKPILLSGIDNVVDLTSGEEIVVALTKDGKLYEWGDNRNGEIANKAADIMPPTLVPLTLPKITYTLPIPKTPGTWTFLDDKGSLIKDNQLYYRVKPFSEGYAAVQRASTNLWTFITVQGEPAFANDFIIVKDFHQSRAAVKAEDGWHFINTKGQSINQDRYSNVDSFANGLAPVLVGNKWGYIGLDGKMAIKPQFAAAQRFENGLAAVQLNGKWGFIDSTGKLVIKAAYSAAGSFSGQAAAVKQNGKWGYINKSGAWIIKPQYEDARAFGGTNLAPVRINGKWGYINSAGKLAIAAQYEDAAPYREGLASVKKNGLWAVIQSTGKALTPFQFVEIQPYNNNVAWVATKSDNGYIDKNGKWYHKAAILKWY